MAGRSLGIADPGQTYPRCPTSLSLGPSRPPSPTPPSQGGLGAQHLPSPKCTAMPRQPALLHFMPCLLNLLFFSTDHPPLPVCSCLVSAPFRTHRYPTHPAHHHPCVQECRQPLSYSSSFTRAALGSKNIIIGSVFRKSRWPKQEQQERWKQVCAANSKLQWLSVQRGSREGTLGCPRAAWFSLHGWNHPPQAAFWMENSLSPARGQPVAHPAPPPPQSSRGSFSCNPAEPSKPSSSIQSGILLSL